MDVNKTHFRVLTEYAEKYKNGKEEEANARTHSQTPRSSSALRQQGITRPRSMTATNGGKAPSSPGASPATIDAASTSTSADEKTPLLAASRKQSEKGILSRMDLNAAVAIPSVSSKSALQADVDFQVESSEVLSESADAATVVLAALSDAASEALDDDETGN